MKRHYYQSPIIFEPFNYLTVDQHIIIHGINEDAHYNKETHNFEVKSNVYMNFNSKTYKLDEYHFHIPAEHIVNCEKHVAKPARPIQELDGRIILFTKSK